MNLSDYILSNPAILATGIGTILGFTLSQVSTVLRERSKTLGEIRAIRRMLEREVAYNRKLLERLQEEVMDCFKVSYPDLSFEDVLADPKKFDRERSLCSCEKLTPYMDKGIWHRQAFDGLISSLPKALSVDEIDALYSFYGRLEPTTSRISALIDYLMLLSNGENIPYYVGLAQETTSFLEQENPLVLLNKTSKK